MKGDGQVDGQVQVGAVAPAQQRAAGSNYFNKQDLEKMQENLYKSVEAVPMEKGDIKQRLEDMNMAAIDEYIQKFPAILRPLAKGYYVLFQGDYFTLTENERKKLRPVKSDWENDQRKLNHKISMDQKDLSRTYEKLMLMEQEVKKYNELVEKTGLQVVELDKAIAAKIKGEDIINVVDQAIFPDKCYNMNLNDMRSHKGRLMGVEKEAKLRYDLLDRKAVEIGGHYKELKKDLGWEEGEYAKADQMRENLERKERRVPPAVGEMAKRQMKRLGQQERIKKTYETIERMTEPVLPLVTDLAQDLSSPAEVVEVDELDTDYDLQKMDSSLDALTKQGEKHYSGLESRAEALFNEILH